MALTDVVNTAIVNITSTEQSTSAVDINRGTNLQYNSNMGQFTTYTNLGVGLNVIPLPFPNPAVQVFIKNLDATKTITVGWTTSGAAAVTPVIVLNPGEFIMFWQNPTGGAGGTGIVALNLTPSAVPCLVELFLGS